MATPEPSPILRRLIALYQGTQLANQPAAFHAAMQEHAREIELALTGKQAPEPLPPILEPAP